MISFNVERFVNEDSDILGADCAVFMSELVIENLDMVMYLYDNYNNTILNESCITEGALSNFFENAKAFIKKIWDTMAKLFNSAREFIRDKIFKSKRMDSNQAQSSSNTSKADNSDDDTKPSNSKPDPVEMELPIYRRTEAETISSYILGSTTLERISDIFKNLDEYKNKTVEDITNYILDYFNTVLRPSGITVNGIDDITIDLFLAPRKVTIQNERDVLTLGNGYNGDLQFIDGTINDTYKKFNDRMKSLTDELNKMEKMYSNGKKRTPINYKSDDPNNKNILSVSGNASRHYGDVTEAVRYSLRKIGVLTKIASKYITVLQSTASILLQHKQKVLNLKSRFSQ